MALRSNQETWGSVTKALHWLIALAIVGIFVWRVFDAGRNEEKIKRVEDALTNIRRAAEARAQERSKPTNAEDDIWNRDNWGAR